MVQVLTTMTALRYICIDNVRYSLFWCCKWRYLIAGFVIRVNLTYLQQCAAFQQHHGRFIRRYISASYNIRLSVQTFNMGKIQTAVFEIISM